MHLFDILIKHFDLNQMEICSWCCIFGRLALVKVLAWYWKADLESDIKKTLVSWHTQSYHLISSLVFKSSDTRIIVYYLLLNFTSLKQPMFISGSVTYGMERDRWFLTHWGRDKMADIFQMTFSHAFSWMKMYELSLKFQWSLFLRVQLTEFQTRTCLSSKVNIMVADCLVIQGVRPSATLVLR